MTKAIDPTELVRLLIPDESLDGNVIWPLIPPAVPAEWAQAIETIQTEFNEIIAGYWELNVDAWGTYTALSTEIQKK